MRSKFFISFFLLAFASVFAVLRAQTPCSTLVAGTYTVGMPQGQFSTLEQALEALRCGGSSGVVVLQLLPGVYSGHYRLDSLPGAQQHLLVLRGGVGVRLERSANGFSGSSLHLVGGRWRLEQLHLVRAAWARQPEALLLITGGRAPAIVNNTFSSETYDSRPQALALRSEAVDSVRIDSNRFTAWSQGIRLAGGNALRFTNNRIEQYSGSFLRAWQLVSPVFSHNHFADARWLDQTVMGIALEEVVDLRFFSNRFSGVLPAPALQLQRPLLGNNLENRIFNNEFNGHWPHALPDSVALFRLDARAATAPLSVFVVHNSFRLSAAATSNGRVLLQLVGWRNASDSLMLANNVLVVERLPGLNLPTVGLVHADTLRLPGTGLFSNGYFSPDSLQAFAVGSLPSSTSFGNWQNTQGYDAGSRFAAPLWQVPQLRLQPAQPLFNNMSANLGWPLFDLPGILRSSPADAGAYEFEPIQREVRLGDLVLGSASCGAATLQNVQFTAFNLGADALPSLPVRLLRNGVPVSFIRLGALAAGESVQAVFPQLQLQGGTQAAHFTAFIDTLADLQPTNDTVRATAPATESVVPVSHGFQNQVVGSVSPGNFWQQQSGQAWQWQVQQGEAPQAPSTDASGDVNGRYLWLNRKPTGQQLLADTVLLQWECFSLAGLGIPEFNYHYFHPQGAGRLELAARIGTQWVVIDSVQTAWQATYTRPWQHRRALIPSNAGALRLRLLLPAGSAGVWGLDNLSLADAVITDLQLDSISVQIPSCTDTGELVLHMHVRNSALGIVQPIRVGGRLQGGTVVYATANRHLLPGARDTVQLRLPFTQAGPWRVEAFAAHISDTWVENDTIGVRLTIPGRIAQLNYEDDFESESGWFAGGQASSWQRAQPAGTRLQSAGSGQFAWITAPGGLPNAQENSWVQSPCFNLTGSTRPRVEFMLWYDLSPGSRVWLEYLIAPGAFWMPLGGAFSGTNWYNGGGTITGWQGQSGGWVQVSHPLDFLSASPQISFRLRYAGASDSSLQAQPVEGVAFDRFRIVGSNTGHVLAIQGVNDACLPVSKTAVVTVVNPNAVQQADLLYRVNGATEQVLPMIASGSASYFATIPAQAAGDRVSYRVKLNNNNANVTEPFWYVDGFFGQRIADVSGPSRQNVTLDAQLTSAGDLQVGGGATDSAYAAWFELEALRYTEIEGFWLQPTAFTSFNVFAQVVNPQGDSLQLDKIKLIQQQLGVGPGGSSYLLFSQGIALRPGEKLIFYIQAADASHLRVLKGNNPASYQDAHVRVRLGRWIAQPGGQEVGAGIPAMRIITRNPASIVRWTNTRGTVLGNQTTFQTQMGLQTDTVILRLERFPCLYLDTILLLPTGQFDLAVTELLEPSLPAVQQGVFYPVKIVIANRGNLAVSDVQLAYRVNGAELAVTQLNRTLAPNDTMHFTFPQLWTWVEGNSLAFCAYPRAFNLDVQRSNDTVCVFRFPTSVAEEALDGLRIYPQPARGEVMLAFEQLLPAAAEWQLFDALGRKVQGLFLEAGQNNYALPLEGIPAGMYYYRLLSNGRYQSGKLLVE